MSADRKLAREIAEKMVDGVERLADKRILLKDILNFSTGEITHPLDRLTEWVLNDIFPAVRKSDRDLIDRLRHALEAHLPPRDPHHSSYPGHVCDAECEEMHHLSLLLYEAEKVTNLAKPSELSVRSQTKEPM